MQGYQKRVSRSPGGITITTFIKNGVPVAEKYVYSSSDHKQVQWKQHGRKHRIGEPAVVYYENGQKTEEYWYQEGELHRVDGPAEIWYRNGRMSLERWYIHGKKHRTNGPAVVRRDMNKQVICEEWFYNNNLHRDNDLPAIIHYKNNQIILECWYHAGDVHRVGGPALIYYENGQKTKEYWYQNNRYGGDVLAYIWLADINNFASVMANIEFEDVDEFRTRVKGPAALIALKVLPLPISQLIYEYYCFQ